jgi:hypothetical protein
VQHSSQQSSSGNKGVLSERRQLSSLILQQDGWFGVLIDCVLAQHVCSEQVQHTQQQCQCSWLKARMLLGYYW